jgi:TolA-binding protein
MSRADLALDRRALLLLLALGLLATVQPPSPAQDTAPREPGARQVPEGLNFANGLFRDRRYDLAAEEYERFLAGSKPGPEADEARFGLANARLYQGRYDLARRQFEEFLKAAPDHPNARTAWYRVGETAYMLGDLPAARKAFETFTGGPNRHRHLETAWPYLGDVCFRQRDLPAARRAYEQALAAYPEGRLADRARFGLGRTLALQGESDAARNILKGLADRGGREWIDRAWLQIGLVESGAGRFEDAVAAFETLERVAPKSPLIAEERFNRAEALARLDRRDEAEALLRALMADAPQNLAAQAAFGLGTSQLERGRADEALTTLDGALSRFSKTPMATALLFRSAEAALKRGQATDAKARFLKAADADPKDPWADDALLRAARLALDARDHAEARRLASAFPGRFPDSPLRADARLVEARAALAEGQPKEAIKLLSGLLDEDRPSPETAQASRYYLGLAYRADGQSARADEILEALARTPAAPAAADAQFLVGQGHIEARRYAEAVSALERYLAGKPKGDVADYALAHLAQAHLELGQPELASKDLDQLAERFPKSKSLPPTRLRLAEAALAAKQADRAAELFRLAAEGDDPALKPRALSGLGWASMEGGKPAEAAAAFGALLDTSPDDPLAPEAALVRGQALEAAGQTDEALKAYARAAEAYPKSSQGSLATLARARLLVASKHPAEAAEAFERYLGNRPDPSTAPSGEALAGLLAEWGWALVSAGKTAEADRIFTRLLDEFPESPHAADARFNLAESAHQARKPGEVVTLLMPVVAEGSKATPRLIESALYRLGRTQVEQEDWPAATKTLDRLITEYPDGPYRREARFLRAEVALKDNDPRTAEEGFAALEAEPPSSSDPEGFVSAVRRRRIQALVALKRWKDVLTAAEAFRSEAPDDPGMAEVDYARGRALQSMAPPEFDKAREAYSAVISARKGGDLAARAQFMRGETYFLQKNYREALRELLKADILYDAPPWQAAALLEAGKVYEQLDQWADAAESYERLRSKFPDDPSATEARARLETARKRAANQSSRSADAPSS